MKRWVKLCVKGQATYIYTDKNEKQVQDYKQKLNESNRFRPSEVEIYLPQDIRYGYE